MYNRVKKEGNICVSKDDKGGKIAVMDMCSYTSKMKSMLADTAVYRKKIFYRICNLGVTKD